MPIIKYVPVHGSPLKLLEYVANENKTRKALITGLNEALHSYRKIIDEIIDEYGG